MLTGRTHWKTIGVRGFFWECFQALDQFFLAHVDVFLVLQEIENPTAIDGVEVGAQNQQQALGLAELFHGREKAIAIVVRKIELVEFSDTQIGLGLLNVYSGDGTDDLVGLIVDVLDAGVDDGPDLLSYYFFVDSHGVVQLSAGGGMCRHFPWGAASGRSNSMLKCQFAI